MSGWLRVPLQQWFLTALLILIGGGLLLGYLGDPQQLQSISRYIQPQPFTAIVLFLMAFTLDSRQLLYAFRSPQPVLWGACVNMALLPPMAWGLMSWQLHPDFAIGLLIAGSVPCTLAAASVWTRKAQGNDAVSLLVTLLTNGLCFLITPFWLSLGTRGAPVELPREQMMVELFWIVLVPTLLAQISRLSTFLRELANRRKIPIGVVAQCMILLMIFSSARKGGQQLADAGTGPGLSAVLLVWITCLGIHLAGLFVSYAGGIVWRFRLEDRFAAAFAGSQKTLPIGLLLATNASMFGEQFPFAVFPMLMFHATQLFVDTFIAGRFSRWIDERNGALPAPHQSSTDGANV